MWILWSSFSWTFIDEAIRITSYYFLNPKILEKTRNFLFSAQSAQKTSTNGCGNPRGFLHLILEENPLEIGLSDSILELSMKINPKPFLEWFCCHFYFSCPRFVIPLEIPLPTHHQEKYFDKLILCQNNEPFSPQLECSTTASIHGRGETRFLWEVKKPWKISKKLLQVRHFWL